MRYLTSCGWISYLSNITENELRLKVIDLGQSVKPILRQQHGVAALLEKDFRTTADGIAVINDQNSDGECCGTQKTLLPK